MAAEMLELDVDVHHAGMGRDRDGCRVFGYRAPGNKYSGTLRNSDLFSHIYTCAHVDVL
jgi:hypothetical protein